MQDGEEGTIAGQDGHEGLAHVVVEIVVEPRAVFLRGIVRDREAQHSTADGNEHAEKEPEHGRVEELVYVGAETGFRGHGRFDFAVEPGWETDPRRHDVVFLHRS